MDAADAHNKVLEKVGQEYLQIALGLIEKEVAKGTTDATMLNFPSSLVRNFVIEELRKLNYEVSINRYNFVVSISW